MVKHKIKSVASLFGFCFIAVFAIIGFYPTWTKCFILAGEVFLITLTYKFKDRVKQIFIVGIIILNIIWEVYYYSSFYLNYGTSFNLSSLLATSQTTYTVDILESEVILPLIVREKRIYTTKTGDYVKYLGFFSKEVLELEKEEPVYDFIQLRSEFMDFGAIAPDALDFYYEGKDKEFWDKMFENRAHIYISSNEIVDAKDLVALNDKGLNLFVMSLEEYQARYEN